MAISFPLVAAFTAGAILLAAGVLHLIPRLGSTGRRVSHALCRAPALDIVITYFTVVPLFVGPALAGWRGFLAAIVGQISGMLVWQTLHELSHPQARRGPRRS